MASPRWCCLGVSLPLLLLLLLRWPGLLAVAEQVALVEVFLEQRPDASDLLQGEVVESSLGGGSSEQRDEEREELEADLVLVRSKLLGSCPGPLIEWYMRVTRAQNNNLFC